MPDQQRWVDDEVKARGWTLSRPSFTGVSSGDEKTRDLVKKMLTALKKTSELALPEYLLMIRPDRLGRGDLLEMMSTLRDFHSLGIRIWTREPEGELKLDTPIEQLMAATFILGAHADNKVRKDKTRSTVYKRRMLGQITNNNAPYGLSIAKDRFSYEPKEPEATAVRQAFALRLTGKGYTVISNWMRKNAPAKDYKSGKPRKKAWSAQQVSQLLAMSAYVGPIADEETFARCKRVAIGRTVTSVNKHPWPLSGVLRCFCGSTLVGSTSAVTDDGRVYRYYCCRDLRVHPKKRSVSAIKLEAQFFAHLTGSGSDDAKGLVEYDLSAPESLAQFDDALRAKRKELKDAQEMKEATIDFAITNEIKNSDIQPRLDRYTALIADLTAEIAELTESKLLATNSTVRRKAARDLMSQMATTWVMGTDEQKRAISKNVAAEIGQLLVEADGTLVQAAPSLMQQG